MEESITFFSMPFRAYTFNEHNDTNLPGWYYKDWLVIPRSHDRVSQNPPVIAKAKIDT
jgi:hypothetical protein